MTPQLKSGFIEDTLLDPHAANNDIASGKQMSFAGPLAGLAQIDRHRTTRARRRTRPPTSPRSSTRPRSSTSTPRPRPAGSITSGARSPSRATAPLVHYYNLTPSGVTHSGNTGVPEWYRNFIVPTLGDQAPLVQQLQLNGQIDGAQTPATPAVTSAGGGPWLARPTRPAPTAPTDRSRSSRPASRSSRARPRPARWCGSTSDPRRSPRRPGLAGVTHADATGNGR